VIEALWPPTALGGSPLTGTVGWRPFLCAADCHLPDGHGILGTMVQQSSFGAPPSVADVLHERYAGRLPDALEDLAGPTHGTVALPLHIAWSGLRTYDLDRPRQCMGLYRTVLAEGQRDDIVRFLNRDLLLAQWPVMRTMISRHVRDVWESAFPELGHRASSAA